MTSTLNNKPLVRSHGLDVLRGIAVLLVLFHHLFLVNPKGQGTWLYRAADFIRSGGWVGVDLFFVLSGFLISGILFRQYRTHGRIKPGEFLIRRGFKIYPAFWVFIAATIVYLRMMQRPIPAINIGFELLFVQNYFPGLWGHTWSLAVEEHCYIGLCAILAIIAATNQRRDNPFQIFPWIVLGIATLALYLRVTSTIPLGPENWRYYVAPTHLRCDAFLLGSLVAYGYHFSSTAFNQICGRFRLAMILAGSACLSPVFFLNVHTDRVVTTWLFTVNAIGSCLILMGTLGFANGRSLLTLPIAKIGEYSYSIYLWHMLIGNEILVMFFGKYHLSPHISLWLPAYLFSTVCAGMALSYLIERPCLQLRERWFAESKTSAPAQVEVKRSERFGLETQVDAIR